MHVPLSVHWIKITVDKHMVYKTCTKTFLGERSQPKYWGRTTWYLTPSIHTANPTRTTSFHMYIIKTSSNLSYLFYLV